MLGARLGEGQLSLPRIQDHPVWLQGEADLPGSDERGAVQGVQPYLLPLAADLTNLVSV